MLKEDFYKKFADTPLEDRLDLFEVSEAKPLTLQAIFNAVSDIDNKIRPFIIEQQKYLKLAERYYYLDK